MAYEMSADFRYKERSVKTPLGFKKTTIMEDELVICSILRAGLSMHYTVLDCFDKAENAFISAYRKHDLKDKSKFEIIIEYLACPDLNDKTLVLVDPMLASGQSLWLAYKALLNYGIPKDIHLMSIIASRPGVDYISEHFPENSTLWLADLDPELNNYGYIVPGLGDAGDLAFGEKLQH